jgi:protein-S-isoprenylcysteine O-methyltransferase Ste14
MSTLVIVLRTVSLLAFAGPMLLGVSGRHGEAKTRAIQEGDGRAPVAANLSAFGLFFPSLLIFSGSSEASMALPLALSGCLLALAGAALVLRSRAELGPAWSFAPKADQGTGLVTTGPLSPRAPPHLSGPRAARHGRSARFQQLACPHDRAVRDCPDLRLARPRGGETAQPHSWRALCRLPTTH